MKKDNIELEILLKPKDFLYFYTGYFLNFNSVLIYFIAFVVFGLFLFFLFSNRDMALSHFLIILLSALVYEILFLALMTYFALENSKKIRNTKYKYIFSNDKAEIIADNFVSHIKWTHFVRAVENSRYFYLYGNTEQKYLIPKSCFQDYEQLADFKELIAHKLGANVQFKKSKENLELK